MHKSGQHLKKADINSFWHVVSTSTSSKTIPTSFPPNSSTTLFNVLIEFCSIRCPVLVEPVKVTFSTTGCAVSALPICPSPNTRLHTPAGKCLLIISTSLIVLNGVNSDGLLITQFLVFSAGNRCQAAIINGQFHGVIDAITPSGRL